MTEILPPFCQAATEDLPAPQRLFPGKETMLSFPFALRGLVLGASLGIPGEEVGERWRERQGDKRWRKGEARKAGCVWYGRGLR